MGTSIWLITSRCTDPAREAEFNRWYDDVHVPDLLTVPHIVAAQRYKLAGPASQTEPGLQYLAMYELDTDDPQSVVQGMREHMRAWRAANRMIDCIEVISSTTFVTSGSRQERAAAKTGS